MIAETFLNEFTYIFNSLDRMAKGTCAGSDGQEICTWDLMPRIHIALTEHIAFEEKELFPELFPEEREEHKHEHERLLSLLAKAEYEFECGYGEQLTVIIQQLTRALKNHLNELQKKVA